MEPSSSPIVLIVEDDEGVARLSARTLEREGIEIVIRLDGRSAQTWLEGHTVDLAILDYGLPDMTAQELAARLQELGRMPPYIVVSGQVDAAVAVTMMKEGARDCLIKDGVLLERLPNAVRQVLQCVKQEHRLRQAEGELERRLRELADANQLAAAQAEELRSKNVELEHFAHAASHDLQEPLRTISAYIGLLREDLGGNLPAEAAIDLDFIDEAASRMSRLIEALLALSRAGRAALRLEAVALDECVNETLQALGMRLQESGAEIRKQALPRVTGDRTLVTQIYHNLISNAAKFSRDEGPLIELTAEPSELGWMLGVRDNGIGIKPEYAEQIFTPFRRLHGAAEYEGSGIGLAICRKAVLQMGGKIWVESEPGCGSHFKFILPADKGDARGPIGERH